MAKDSETFIGRWSRLKRSGGGADPAAAPAPQAPAANAPQRPDAHSRETQAAETPLPELPPIDQLTPDSDFRPFMDPRVPEALRRMALKKLYADPHFNVPDMLDDYAGDYTLIEALPAGMAGKLAHARRTLLGRDEADRIEAEERQIAEEATGDSGPAVPADTAEAAPGAEAHDETTETAQSRTSEESRNRNG